MRAGVIDIGSNSIKCLIAEKDESNLRILESLKNFSPIGRSTFLRGRISQQNINQTIVILEKYKEVLNQYEVTNIRIIATTAVREARNREIFLDTVFRKTDFQIEVLNVGDVVYFIDSYLSHKLKNKFPIHTRNLIIGELGSGSLDISIMKKGFTLMNVGLPIGALRIKQLLARLDGSQEETTEAIGQYIENEFVSLKRNLPRIRIDDIILIDENYFHLQNILPHKFEESDFFYLTHADAKKVLSLVVDKRNEEIARQYNLPLEISDTIVAYMMILEMFFKMTDTKKIYVLETSLAEAILANMLFDLELNDKYNKMNQLISVANSLCYKYNQDLNHVRAVANMAKVIFDNLAPAMGLKEEDALLLLLAAYLHDIGQFIHNRAHHKHSEYVINSLNLFRMTDQEIKVCACIARYHRKAFPSSNHMYFNSLPTDKKIVVQKLASILRMADSLDRSHKQKVNDLDIEISGEGDIAITVDASGNFVLEKAEFAQKKTLFEEITGSKANLIVNN